MAVTGSAYAGLILPKAKAAAPPKPPKAPTLKGVTGSVKAPGAPVSRSTGIGRMPTPKGVSGAVSAPDRRGPGLQKLVAESKAAMPKPGSRGLSIGTITANPLHDLSVAGEAMKGGYKVLGGATGTGVGREIGKLAGNTASNLINLPAQAIPTAYDVGKTAVKSLAPPGTKLHSEGESEQRALAKSFAHESAAAHLVKGEWHEALSAAERNPVNTGLEIYGGLSAADRLAGAAGRIAGTPELKAKLAPADPGATTVSRQPKTLLAPSDQHASVPLRPYDKGLVKRLEQGRNDSQTRPEGLKLTEAYRKHYDQTEGSLLRINQNSRSDVINKRMGGMKNVPGKDAIAHFGWGTLSDPKVLNDEGTPVYRDQLSQLVEHHSKPVEDESLAQKQNREANMVHAQKLLEDKAFEQNPHAAYKAALKVAADKRALEPDLEKHGVYSKQQMREAKVKAAFQFHYRDQNPWVEPAKTGSEGSVFKIGGKDGQHVPVSKIYAELQRKGVNPDQLSFTTTKPFQNPDRAFNRTPAIPRKTGAAASRGTLTGAAFKNGQYDPTYDAVVRQHLTDQKIVDDARAVAYKNGRYTLTKEHLAKLVEQRMGALSESDKAIAQKAVDDLRAGKTGPRPSGDKQARSVYFDATGSKSPWQKAMETKELVEGLHPDVKLEPVRIAHPYAPKSFRDAQVANDISGRLDPAMFTEGTPSRFPKSPIDRHNPEAGEVGLVHKAIADAEKKYEKITGSTTRNAITKPATVWRRANIAYSVRHVPGLSQEIGLRALVNKIGPQSYLRGRKAYATAMEGAAEHPFEASQLRGMTGGTVAQMTEDLNRHVTSNQLWGTKAGKVAEVIKAGEEHKITGAPLRAVKTAIGVYSKVTTSILRIQRKILERPQELSGLGKHLNDEAKRITGRSLPVIKQMQGVQAQVARGLLDQKALDAAARSLKEYWGDWQTTTPAMKNAMLVSPFFKWYVNSLKFIYHTMPVHHPIKTGLLTIAESATAEQRRGEGQGYKKGLKLANTQLAEGQQGSLPEGGGFRVGQEYYTPAGAVSSGLEGALGAVMPYASDAWAILHGTNPIDGKTLENKNYEQQTDANQRILLAILSGLEAFVPPERIAKQLLEKGNPEKEDPWGKALGVPPSLWKVIRPLRTEKERTQSGEPRLPKTTVSEPNAYEPSGAAASGSVYEP